jgi:uridine kinase
MITADLAGLIEVVRAVEETRRRVWSGRALVVGVSGIDASGKGHVTRLLADRLGAGGWNVATVTADWWLNAPDVRFGAADPAGTFLRCALRLDELFDDVVRPLRSARSVTVDFLRGEETSPTLTRDRLVLADVDILVVEGIFLFQRRHRDVFDLRIWIESTFETALLRAVNRRQEALDPEETVAAYEAVYFPAQRVHLSSDRPRAAAHLIVVNDPRLART